MHTFVKYKIVFEDDSCGCVERWSVTVMPERLSSKIKELQEKGNVIFEVQQVMAL